MKKLLSILGLVGVIGIGSFAFASDSDGIVENSSDRDYQNRPDYEEQMEDRYDHMRDYSREDMDKALENGEISEEDAKEWQGHDGYRNNSYEENGYRGCRGRKEMGMRRGMGRGHRY